MFSRSDDDNKETVTVYTDIDKLTVAFNAENVALLAEGSSPTVTDDGVLTVDTALVAHVVSDGFPAATGNAADTTTRDYEADDTFSGSFGGAEGEYSCTGGTCMAEAGENGLTTLTGTWTFTPSEDEMTLLPDDDYLHFGYWSQEPISDEGTYAFRSFHAGSGSNAFTADDVSDLTGTASYAGPAGGMYIRKTLDAASGAPDVVSSGTFTADTNLTATFGQIPEENVGADTIAPADFFSIKGTVDNFMDGNTSISDWSVKLNKTTFENDVNTFDGTTTGSEGANAGTWQGRFFGNGDPDTTDHPGSVAGEFNAHFLNGHVNGAFGAVRQD